MVLQCNVVLYSASLLYSMDVKRIKVFLTQNSETIKKIVELMFEDCKRDIEKLRNGNNELRTENADILISIYFYHNQTNDLKRRINELQSAFSTVHDAG